MVKKKIEPITILIDSREQRPLMLPNSRIATLKTGDYSVEGMTEVVAVERKSLSDLFGCIGHDRERFVRELERLANIRYRALVVEASFDELLAGLSYSQVNTHAAAGSIIAWSVRYGIPVWFAGSRRNAAGIINKILNKAAEEWLKEKEIAP